MNKKILILLGSALTVVLGVWLYPKFLDYRYRQELERANEAALKTISEKDIIRDSRVESPMDTVSPPVIPEKAYLEVPFLCQAPHQNAASWKIHHASCEEAALLQAVWYDKGIRNIGADSADAILRSMIAWQESIFKIHKDLHADSVKMLMTGFFGYTDDAIQIIRRAKISDLREWVAKGYPVIAPTYGRTLKNPFYTAPGPTYHMLTVIGYTADRIITNDVGTRRGKDFSYANAVFQKAMDEEGGDCLVILRRVKH